MNDFGQRIREARKRKRLTQIDLANRVGISQAALSEIETGSTKEPMLSHLRTLAYELNDDFGDEGLRSYLESRTNNPSLELFEQVVAFLDDNEWAVKLFVVRLARVNEHFLDLLDPGKLDAAKVEAGKTLRFLESVVSDDDDKGAWKWFLGDLSENDEAIGALETADLIFARSMGEVGDDAVKPKTRKLNKKKAR